MLFVLRCVIVITLYREGCLAARNGSNVIRETNGTEGQTSSDYLSTPVSPGLATLPEAVPSSVESKLREDVAPSVESFQSNSVPMSGNELENLEENTLSSTYQHSTSSVPLVFEDKVGGFSSSFYFTYIDSSLPLRSTFGGELNQEVQSLSTTYPSVSSDVDGESDLLPSMSQEMDSILTTHVKLPFQSREKFIELHDVVLKPTSILPEAELTSILDNIYDNSASLSDGFTLFNNSPSKLYASEETVINQEILSSNFPNTGILSTASEELLDDSMLEARTQSKLEPTHSVTEIVTEDYSKFNDTLQSVELISPTSVRSNETTPAIPNITLSSLSGGVMEENNASLVLTTVTYTANVTDKNVSMKSTKTPTDYNETEIISTTTTTENMTIGPTALRLTGKTEIPMKNITVIHVESLGTTAGRKPSSTTTEIPMKTKATKNMTAVPTIAVPTAATKVYTKPTKYPFKPDNTPTPKKKYTTERTTPKEEENNLTPWRPPVYISVKLRMTMAELCSQLHDFSSIIISVLEMKLGEKAHHFRVVVLEELECIPGTNFEKRDAEITVNFFLIDPRGKYDMEVTEKLAELIAESEVDTSGTVFSGKIVAFKVHGVTDKGTTVEEKKVPPVENRKLSGGIIALLAVASLVAIFIFIFIIFQLMVCRRRMGMKKMRQVYDGSRPSLECHSIVDSIQLTSVTTFTEQGSKPSFAYYNPALHIGDPSKDFSSNPLDAIGLEEMVEEPDAIEAEFLMLPNVMPKLSEVPVGAEDKNRYANVIPFPSSRVSLLKLEGEEHSEYINANFIRGYLGQPQRYIATQAPLEDTRGDFWRMIWQQQSRVVIMLTDLEEQGLSKCAEYWPNTDGADKVRIYGDYEIILQRREVTENWVQSTMILKHLDRNLCREIQHYWLTCWPDQGTPADPSVLLRFLLHVRPDMEEYRGPTVVHCSPGTGRTGTLLALDICMRSLDDTDTVDVLGTVHMLRQDRAGAVQTQEQYFFIYEAVLQYAVKFYNANRSFKSSMASLELQHR